MFDRLIDIILGFGKDLIPIVIINDYEMGVRLRLGKASKKVLGPGPHHRIPFVDRVIVTIVKDDTLNVQPINITTLDNKTISVGAVIEFSIDDIFKFIVDTNEARSNMHDICRAVIANHLTECTWDDCNTKKTSRHINKILSNYCKVLGINIKNVTLTDLCISRVIKLIGDKAY